MRTKPECRIRVRRRSIRAWRKSIAIGRQLDEREATIVITDKKVTVKDGHVGESDLHVTADAKAWFGFLRQERNIVWALFSRLNGSPLQKSSTRTP